MCASSGLSSASPAMGRRISRRMQKMVHRPQRMHKARRIKVASSVVLRWQTIWQSMYRPGYPPPHCGWSKREEKLVLFAKIG